ncbi:MAG: hypothetical protein AABZ33_13625 [Chloroflexota bacterium]
MEGLLVITGLVAVLAAFDVLALRWGADSREIHSEAGRPAATTGLVVR